MLAALIFIIRKSIRLGLPYTTAIIFLIHAPMWWLGMHWPHPFIAWLATLITFSPMPVTALWLSVDWNEYNSERRQINESIKAVRFHMSNRKQLKAAPPKAGNDDPTIYG
jgi:hypothetical protein